MKTKYLFTLTFLLLFSFSFSFASEIETTYVEIILDASNSMNESIDGETKIDTAKRVLSNLVEQWEKESAGKIQMGLRVYGNNFDASKTLEIACSDTTLEVPIAENTASSIKQKVSPISALGYTPIAYSLEQTESDFQAGQNNVIILISDGKESCKGDPCAVAKKLNEAGIKLKVHVIGFAVDAETKDQLECIADATQGKYYTASNADELQLVAQEVKLLVSENIAAPVQTSKRKKIVLNKPGRINIIKPKGIDYRPQYVKIRKAGTDETILELYSSNGFGVKVLPAGRYDVYVQNQNGGNVLYRKNFEILSGKEVSVSLNSGFIFQTSSPDVKKSLKYLYVHALPADEELYNLYQAYAWQAQVLPPGKYKIYVQYQSSNKTLLIDELEVINGEIIEIEL